jgi:subtilisin family serine protease
VRLCVQVLRHDRAADLRLNDTMNALLSAPFRCSSLRRSARLWAWLSAPLLLVACGGGSAPAAPASPSTPGTPPATASGPQVLVQVALGADIAALAGARGLTVAGQFGRRPIYRLQLPPGADAAAVAAQLAGVAGVVFAEPDALSATPESQRNTIWVIGGDSGSYAAQWAPTTLRLAEAHASSLGSGVRVAVLDTGIEAGHPAFAGRLARRGDGSVLGRDFVDDDDNPAEGGSRADLGYGHGTHVAGLVALAAPGARLMPVRVLNPAGEGNAWVLAEALAWAVDPDANPATDDGAHLINMSLGSARPTRLLALAVSLANCEFDDDDDDFNHPGFDDDRARCARGHGAAVFSAAGNDGSADLQIFPAAEGLPGTRAVTATTAAQRLAPFSNSGGWIKLAAPGEQIISAVPGGAWGSWSGTSMAAPLATGTAALVMATPAPNPLPGASGLRQWRAEDLMKRLEDRAKPVCSASVKQIDAAAAVSDSPAPDPACP